MAKQPNSNTQVFFFFCIITESAVIGPFEAETEGPGGPGIASGPGSGMLYKVQCRCEN